MVIDIFNKTHSTAQWSSLIIGKGYSWNVCDNQFQVNIKLRVSEIEAHGKTHITGGYFPSEAGAKEAADK